MAREREESVRTQRERPSKSAQEREEERDLKLRQRQADERQQYTPEAEAEKAAWLAAASQGPVNAGGGVLNARESAGSMEDGGVADNEESDAMQTLRSAMADSRQKTPGHQEPVARHPRMSNRSFVTLLHLGLRIQGLPTRALRAPGRCVWCLSLFVVSFLLFARGTPWHATLCVTFEKGEEV